MANYSNGLYKDYLELQRKYEILEKEYKFQKLRADIAEDEQHRLEKLQQKKAAEIRKEEEKVQALQKEVLSLTKKLSLSELEKKNIWQS